MASVRVIALALLLGIAASSPVAAQRVSLGFEAQSWGHEELRGFSGGVVRIEWPNGVELFYHMGHAGWSGEGTLCAGLVDPMSCVLEPLDFSSMSFGFGAGWALGRWPAGEGEVALIPFAGLAFATLSKTGTVTDGRASDSVSMAEIGAALRYRTPPLLWDRVGFFGEGRASTGWSPNIGCEDCFDVLREGTSRVSFVVGVAVGR